MSSDYERLGREPGISSIIDDFIDRVFDDFIIGFMFVGRDKAPLKAREVEFAISHLGGPNRYGGRPLHQVHQPLKINNGHFRRRLAILRTILVEHGVADEISERWLEHDRKLMSLITTGEDCVDDSAS